MPINKDPSAPRLRFTRGAALSPTGDLVAWLDRQSALVRLPCTLTLTPSGGIATATLGASASDTVAVTLTDLAMGVSLKDRLRQVCTPGGTCTVWLIGRWACGEAQLDVREMDGAVDDVAAAIHAEVEAP